MSIRAAAYGRVSSDRQKKEATIKTQIRTIQEWVGRQGGEYEVVAWYLDEGVTGTVPLEQRPRGRQLIADAIAGNFETILIYDGDRVSREEHIWPLFKVQMQNAGINVISVTEGWNTADDMGSFMAGISALLGAEDRKKMLKRMRDGRVRAAMEGKWPYAVPTYGYRVVNGYLAIEVEESEVVKRIYDMYTTQRMGIVPIANALNREGIPTPAVNKGQKRESTERWRRIAIHRILVNPVYTGEIECTFSFHDKPIPIKVPTVIDVPTWQQAKQIRESRWTVRTRNSHLLAGLVKCGHCGLSCSILVNKFGRYYRCNGKYMETRGEGITCPGSPYTNADKLEAAVWEMIEEWARNPGQILQEFVGQSGGLLDRLVEIRT